MNKPTATMTISTHIVTTSSTTDIKHSDIIPAVPVGVIMVLFVLLVTVVVLLLLIYYKRKRSALVNLTKPHKGSEENSYASSEHSHQQGSKYSESPEPGYDVIKPINVHGKAKSFPPKQKSTHIDMNLIHSSEYASIKDANCDLLHHNSSHETTGSHICSSEYFAPSTKDDPSMDFQKYGVKKREVCTVDSEIEKGINEQKQLMEDAANGNNDSTKGEAPPIPPQTFEMMYTTVQKQPKVNAGMDSEFEDSTPPSPPQTTEMMYTAVQKRPKDSILAEVDDAPPILPYMEKENKETEATAKGSDEGSPPPVPPQTTEML